MICFWLSTLGQQRSHLLSSFLKDVNTVPHSKRHLRVVFMTTTTSRALGLLIQSQSPLRIHQIQDSHTFLFQAISSSMMEFLLMTHYFKMRHCVIPHGQRIVFKQDLNSYTSKWHKKMERKRTIPKHYISSHQVSTFHTLHRRMCTFHKRTWYDLTIAPRNTAACMLHTHTYTHTCLTAIWLVPMFLFYILSDHIEQGAKLTKFSVARESWKSLYNTY